MNISRKSINSVTVLIVIVILILFGLTFYNYYQSGKFNFSSISIGALLLLILTMGRKSALKDK